MDHDSFDYANGHDVGRDAKRKKDSPSSINNDGGETESSAPLCQWLLAALCQNVRVLTCLKALGGHLRL
jgi:hypothetical protein